MPSPKKANPKFIEHKPRPRYKEWNECLDEAVEKHFPDVRCTTVLTRSGWLTKLASTRVGSNGEIKPSLVKRVSAFVAGFMASEDSLS